MKRHVTGFYRKISKNSALWYIKKRREPSKNNRHFYGVQVVGGSNPLAPTNKNNRLHAMMISHEHALGDTKRFYALLLWPGSRDGMAKELDVIFWNIARDTTAG